MVRRDNLVIVQRRSRRGLLNARLDRIIALRRKVDTVVKSQEAMLDDFFHVEGKCRGKACLLLEWVFEQKPQNSSPEPAITRSLPKSKPPFPTSSSKYSASRSKSRAAVSILL